VKSLKEVAGEIGASLPAGFDLTKAALGDMAARYTMDKEREIHLAVAAAVPAAAIGALPMAAEDREEPGSLVAAREDAESAPVVEGGDEGDLGDNVELF
jgi:hypothetical protein